MSYVGCENWCSTGGHHDGNISSKTAAKQTIISLHFLDGQMEDLAALNARVNIKDFQIPEGFDLESVVSAITTVSFISQLIFNI